MDRNRKQWIEVGLLCAAVLLLALLGNTLLPVTVMGGGMLLVAAPVAVFIYLLKRSA